MKRSDATVLAVVGVVGVIAAFWFVVLAPKRSTASDLSSQVNDLKSQLSQQQQTVSGGRQAQSSFAESYHKLVVLGKAVPADSEQASLLVQLNGLAAKAGVSFRSLTLNQQASVTSVPTAPPPTTTTPATTSTSTDTTSTTSSTDTTSTTSTSTATASTTAAPTEATAATLPLGAGIGPAGLPVMPYNLTFSGGYFQISKFLHELDSLVQTPNGGVTVSGRLITVNGFDLAPPPNVGSTTGAAGPAAGTLEVKLSVTTYVAPAEQGITAGATPSGPAPTTPSTAVPTSTPATPVAPSTGTATPAADTTTPATP